MIEIKLIKRPQPAVLNVNGKIITSNCLIDLSFKELRAVEDYLSKLSK